MTDPTNAPPTRSERNLHDAMWVIAHGTIDEKLHYIATHDPDLYVHHVLEWGIPYDSRETVRARRSPTERAVLDEVIARISLERSVRHHVRRSA